MPERIRLSRAPGWRMHPGTVKVDRTTRWGNPFRVVGKPGRGGSIVGPAWSDAKDNWGRPAPAVMLYTSYSHDDAVTHAVELYQMLLDVRRRDHPQQLAEWLAPLVGRDLGCWCPLDEPCHADVLLGYANGGDVL